MQMFISITPFDDYSKMVPVSSRDEALVRAGIGIGRGGLFSWSDDLDLEVLCKYERGQPQDTKLMIRKLSQK